MRMLSARYVIERERERRRQALHNKKVADEITTLPIRGDDRARYFFPEGTYSLSSINGAEPLRPADRVDGPR